MAENEPPTVEQVIGRNLRRLRSERAFSQDQVARAAAAVGLSWTRPVVASVEAGTKSIGVEELLLLALALGTYPREFLAGEGAIRLGRGVEAQSSSVAKKYLSGSGATTFDVVKDLMGWGDGDPDHMWEIFEPPENVDEVIPGEAETKLGRKWGVPAVDILERSLRRWGRSLTAQRDARMDIELANRSEPATASAIQRMRGHITRQLTKELEEDVSPLQEHILTPGMRQALSKQRRSEQ